LLLACWCSAVCLYADWMAFGRCVAAQMCLCVMCSRVEEGSGWKWAEVDLSLVMMLGPGSCGVSAVYAAGRVRTAHLYSSVHCTC
jgi:hypothetical protein